MAGYADLPGVRTWYDEHGDGEAVVMLHGGMTDSRCFAANVGALAEHFHVYTPDRRAHGRTPDVEGPLTADAMVSDTVDFLTRVVGGPAHIVGYSAGAMLAMLLALREPSLVRQLVLVSGFVEHDGMVPGMTPDPGAELPPMIRAAYAEVSPDGADHFPVVAAKVLALMNQPPAFAVRDLAAIKSRTMVMAGDDDLVKLDHTAAISYAIGTSELAIVPGATHVLLQEKPELCNRIMVDFLTKPPAPTYMPIRRA